MRLARCRSICQCFGPEAGEKQAANVPRSLRIYCDLFGPEAEGSQAMELERLGGPRDLQGSGEDVHEVVDLHRVQEQLRPHGQVIAGPGARGEG